MLGPPRIVALAVQTGMRSSELRLMRWRQVVFDSRMITVGKSKIEAGTGRQIPMTNPAYQTLSFWAANFPNRNPNHFILPAEKYAAEGDEFTPKAYKTDPTNPSHFQGGMGGREGTRGRWLSLPRSSRNCR